MASRFPRAWTSDVKRDDAGMEYTNIEKMDIGARPSNRPGNVNEIKSLEHVGKEVRGSAKAAK